MTIDTSKEYVDYLINASMLEKAKSLFDQRNSFRSKFDLGALSRPNSAKALDDAENWISLYPPSIITNGDKSPLAVIGDVLQEIINQHIGFQAIYLTPVNQSGGLDGYEYKFSVDGNFDAISTDIDKTLGTLEDYKGLVKIANDNSCHIIDNLIALHTGQGPDFLLALLGEKRYRNLYQMAEIPKKHWHLLPAVNANSGTQVPDSIPSQLITRELAQVLSVLEYIPGAISPNDADPKVKVGSGWSATGEIPGIDGKVRRWVYLHYFKPGQPVLNHDHPDCQAVRLINGVVIAHLKERGAKGLRMDAVPFSLEILPEGREIDDVHTPSAIRKANQRASLVRQLEGFSFQELSAPLKDVRKFSEYGADLTYDFFTRTPYLHALLTGDATLLRLSYELLVEAGIQPKILIHDLQNHDEFTYQLPEFEVSRQTMEYAGQKVKGRRLRDLVIKQMNMKFEGKDWAALYRQEKDGIATTMVGFLAAALDIDPFKAGSCKGKCCTAGEVNVTDQEKAQIKKAHILAVKANAWVPGVFCLSGWDLVGAWPLHRSQVENLTTDHDYRWINRGGYDLIGTYNAKARSVWGLSPAETLYGSLIEQSKNGNSFLSELKKILQVRRQNRIASGDLVRKPPEVEHQGLCLLPISLSGKRLGLTLLNFGREEAEEEIDFSEMFDIEPSELRGRYVWDAYDGEFLGNIGRFGRLVMRDASQISVDALSGRFLIVVDEAHRTSPKNCANEDNPDGDI